METTGYRQDQPVALSEIMPHTLTGQGERRERPYQRPASETSIRDQLQRPASEAVLKSTGVDSQYRASSFKMKHEDQTMDARVYIVMGFISGAILAAAGLLI